MNSSDQLELWSFQPNNGWLTVEEGFSVFWKEHLEGKACARPFNSNRKAICKSIGGIYWDALTEPDVLRHVNRRTMTGIGPQTIRHDLKLLTMAYNKFRKWKRRGYVLSGVDFAKLKLPLYNPCGDIQRPKAPPRKKVVSPEEFSRWIEHCPERLKERSYFALDTGLSPVDLRRLRPSHYNPYNDCLDIQRHKTGKSASLPLTARCRRIVLEAVEEKREFVLDWTNDQKEVEQARKASGVSFWFGRDLRKTYANAIYKGSKDALLVSQGLVHTDPRTALTHYIIRDGGDLRPHLEGIERAYK